MEERAAMQKLLRDSKTIAVVGLSSNPQKDSYIVAHHLVRQGYTIIPINPNADTILGQRVYRSLADLPDRLAAQVDIVNVFRPASELGAIVDQAIAHLPNLKGVWAQKGIVDEQADFRARLAGLTMIQDRCIRTQHLYARFG